MKHEEHKLAEKIIERFRVRLGWTPNHSRMKFGEISLGYYDTLEKGNYFSLKYADIEFTSQQNGYTIDFKEDRRQPTFDLMVWLNQLDVITKTKPAKVVVDGVEYQPIPQS